MTIEDIKNICQIYDNLRRERDAATIAYNSEDAFWAHVLTTYNFSRPSIPSNLDEAAKEYAKITSVKVWGEIDPKKDLKGYMQRANYSVGLLDAFKAGVNYALSQINLPVWRKRNKILGWYLNPINMTLCHDGYEISLEELKNLVHEN